VLLDRLLPVSLRDSFSKLYSTVRDPDVFRPLPGASIKERPHTHPYNVNLLEPVFTVSLPQTQTSFPSTFVHSNINSAIGRTSCACFLFPPANHHHQYCNNHHVGLSSPKALLAELVLDPSDEKNKKNQFTNKKSINQRIPHQTSTKTTSTTTHQNHHDHVSIRDTTTARSGFPPPSQDGLLTLSQQRLPLKQCLHINNITSIPPRI
jgi:hypothetical protein